MKRELTLRYARGFTLIELTVVVAIVAMLAAIVLASLDKSKTQSKSAATGANIRQYELALQNYAQENSGQYPAAGANPVCLGSTSCKLSGNTYSNNSTVDAALAPFLGSPLPSINSYAFTGGDGKAYQGTAYKCTGSPCYSPSLYVIVQGITCPAGSTPTTPLAGFCLSLGFGQAQCISPSSDGNYISCVVDVSRL